MDVVSEVKPLRLNLRSSLHLSPRILSNPHPNTHSNTLESLLEYFGFNTWYYTHISSSIPWSIPSHSSIPRVYPQILTRIPSKPPHSMVQSFENLESIFEASLIYRRAHWKTKSNHRSNPEASLYLHIDELPPTNPKIRVQMPSLDNLDSETPTLYSAHGKSISLTQNVAPMMMALGLLSSWRHSWRRRTMYRCTPSGSVLVAAPTPTASSASPASGGSS